MNLLTKAIEKTLEKYPLYSQDGKGGNAKVICKYFFGNFTWYVLEGRKMDSDYEFYGIVKNDAYEEAEYGYFTLSQLKEVRHWGYPCVERDMYFKSCKVSECKGLSSMLNF